jgi:tetratricopeptide (TPR) repeat protein/TolB-like protein/predicted Ser/Thr protein kinase
MKDKFISHYRIIGELGAGGMGVVYRAEDTKLGRTVALKFIAPRGIESAEEKARFLHEAQAAASLGHPNICVVHEIDEADGRLFMAMEYVEGESLKDRIARGPLKIDETLDVAIQIAQGLDAAHRKSVVHRDVKPANVMIEAGGLVKIMDFGLAKMSGRSRLTKTGTTLGTAAYMSPEQARGEEADHRSDIWSLGAVIYEMVTGRTPFMGDYEQAVLYSIMNEAPEPLTAVRAGVPMELDRIVGKALAKDRSERYQHADELVADLRALRKSLEAGAASRTGTAGATPIPAPAPGAKPSKKRLAKILIPVCVAAAAVVAFVILRPVLFSGAIATARRPIAVIAFENQTGDPQYDNLKRVIPNLLVTSLEQSKYLQVVTWERLRDILKQMGGGSIEDIDAETGFEICRREGIGTIVTGSFVKLGDKFVTDIKVLKVKSKDLITSGNAEGKGVESIPGQVDRLSREIARGIGLSEPEIEETQRPVTDVTTSSMEAYAFYLKAVDARERYYMAEVIRELEKALQIDTTFAAAYLLLGDAHGESFSSREALRDYSKALTFSEKATERERLYIEARCAERLDRDSEKSILLYKELLKKYPREKWGYYYLGNLFRLNARYDEAISCLDRALELVPTFGTALNALAYVYVMEGDYEKALRLFQRYVALFPGDANPLDSMAETYFLMGKLDDAIKMYAKAYEMKPEIGAAMKLAYIYGVRGDFPEAIRWIDRDIAATSLPGVLTNSYCWKAYFLFASGETGRALDEARHALAIADSTGNPGTLAHSKAVEGFLLLARGEYAGARDALEAAIKYQEPPYQVVAPNYLASAAFFRGLVALKSGDLPVAQRYCAEMRNLVPAVRKEVPTTLDAVNNRLALLAAEIMLAQGRANDAIKAFGRDFRIYKPMGTRPTLYAVNVPFDQDIIPRGYATKGDLDKAIAEYKKLLTFDPASKDRRLKNPRYEYRLAKLLEQRGLTAEALAHYRIFLRYWKDAEPGLPELIDAKARAEALGSSRS